MARTLQSRLHARGTLVTEGPLHVGGMEGCLETDLPLAVDGQGRFYVPGTSLAGVLRAWVEERQEPVAQALWGPRMSRDRPGDGGHASHVIVEDGVVELPPGSTAEIRQGVGIDRIHGAAADRIKHDREVLPAGTGICFEMTLEVPTAWNGEARPRQGAFACLLRALESGEVCLGAGRSRGLGRVRLTGLSLEEEVLDTPSGVLDALRARTGVGRGPRTPDLAALAAYWRWEGSARVTILVDWEPAGPLMVKAERSGVAIDTLPLTTAVGSELAFVLPGSGIKGALRTQAERIVRTVLGREESQAFLEQLEVPLVEWLFGARGRKQGAMDAETYPTLGLSALRVDDCRSKARLDPARWRAVESAPDEEEVQAALGSLGLPAGRLDHAFHVAVDRWTGGAAEGLLFDVLEPHGLAWEPITLRLDLARIPEGEQLPAVALLLLVLRDLAADRIPLGYGTNRGMGAVRVREVLMEAESLPDGLSALAGARLTAGRLEDLDGTLRSTLRQKWQAWIKQTRPS